MLLHGIQHLGAKHLERVLSALECRDSALGIWEPSTFERRGLVYILCIPLTMHTNYDPVPYEVVVIIFHTFHT